MITIKKNMTIFNKKSYERTFKNNLNQQNNQSESTGLIYSQILKLNNWFQCDFFFLKIG